MLARGTFRFDSRMRRLQATARSTARLAMARIDVLTVEELASRILLPGHYVTFFTFSASPVVSRVCTSMRANGRFIASR